MDGFEKLSRIAARLISDDFSEKMWRSGYADFDSYPHEITNISKFTDEALPIFRRLMNDDHLPEICIQGIEENRSSSGSIAKKLLCMFGAFVKMSPKLPGKETIPTILSAACLYLRIVPLSKQLGVGFSLFQKHIYLILIESIKAVYKTLSGSHEKYLLNTLRNFPNFVNETAMEETECLAVTAELFVRLIFNDTNDFPQFAASNSVGILTLKETDISDLGIGCISCFCLSEMTRRYVSSEDAAGTIFISFFPFLLCVDHENGRRGGTLSAINSQTARQSDLLADFLAHLFSDLHVHVKLSHVIQQLIDRAPEKADYRDRVVKVACRLARCLVSTSHELENLIEWTIAFGRTSKTNNRVVAVDFLHCLRNICTSEAKLNLIIKHLLSRTRDTSSNVRIRALALLGDCVTTLSQSKSLVSTTTAFQSENVSEADNDSSSRSSNEREDVPKIEVEIAVLTTAIKLADDQRVHVRRAALGLIETCLPMIAPLCNFTSKTGTGSDVAVVFRRGFETCAQRCVDCSVIVRNQAAKSTTEVLLKTLSFVPSQLVASDDLSWLPRIWLSSVIPLVSDQEQRIQEKIVDLIATIVMPTMGANKNLNQQEQLAWSLLNLLALKTRSLSGHFRTGLTNFIKTKQAGTYPKLNQALKAAADTIENDVEQFNAAAWFLVAEITAALGTISETKRAVKILEQLAPGSVWLSMIKRHGDQSAHVALTTCECILGVLAAQMSYAPETLSNDVDKLVKDLSNRLSKCTIQPALIRATCTVLFLGSQKDALKVLTSLVEFLLESEAKALEIATPEKMRRCLAAVGCIGELAVATNTKSKSTLGRISQITDIVFARITNMAQKEETDEKVKAQCLFTIGQLCVADRASALRLVNVISSFLSESSSDKTPVLVKMAALSVLTDWCIWHTSVVEQYVDHMANCLRDSMPVMRRHALGAIGRLLDGNFIRWHDSLFFRFVTIVIDEDASIQSAAKRYFEMIVIPREKHFFLRKFVETIIHFNSYVGGAKIGMSLSQSQSMQSQTVRQEKQLATMCQILGLSGDSNRKRRFGIYRYMIDSMVSTEERLGLIRRLIDNVLLATVREEIDITNQAAGEALIRDACLILCDERLKFGKVLASGGAGDDDDDVAPVEDENADRRLEAKRAIFVEAVRQVIVKELFPAIISVRMFVERVKPNLLNPICDLLVASYSEYKTELGDALADDPELHRDLEFHMRQAHQRQREQAMLRTLTNQGEQEIENSSTADPSTGNVENAEVTITELPPPPSVTETRRSTVGSSKAASNVESNEESVQQVTEPRRHSRRLVVSSDDSATEGGRVTRRGRSISKSNDDGHDENRKDTEEASATSKRPARSTRRIRQSNSTSDE